MLLRYRKGYFGDFRARIAQTHSFTGVQMLLLCTSVEDAVIDKCNSTDVVKRYNI